MLIGAPFGVFLLSLFADKHGRKQGLIVCLLLLAVCAYLWSLIPIDNIFALMSVGFILCSILYYYAILACSVYLGEEFPTRVRMRGSGFAHAVGRIAGIVSPYVTAFLLQSYGTPTVFLVNGIVLVVSAIIIGICGEETRGKTLEEINDSVLPNN
jgi:putative MFS transporter